MTKVREEIGKAQESVLPFNWKMGIILAVAVSVIRMMIVFQANRATDYKFVPIIFIVMILMPFILLSSKGRKGIGITMPKALIDLIPAFLAGMIFCLILFSIFYSLFHTSISNSFVYIGKSYPNLWLSSGEAGKFVYFFISSVVAMTFSPIGEEFFYRGLIHESLVTKFSHRMTSHIESSIFAITHLAHFGIVYETTGWKVLVVPSIIWLAAMYGVSRLFIWFKVTTQSIWGAVACHGGFNLVMTYLIFYCL